MPGKIPRLDSPFKVWVQPTKNCNLDCRLCYDNCGQETGEELTDSEWTQLFGELADQGVITYFVEGGEPLAREGFLDILESVTPRAMVYLRTNGTLVTDEVAERIRRIGIGGVCVDLLGATASTHDALTGAEGSFEASIRGIRSLVAQGLPMMTTIIMNRRNASEIQQFFDLSYRLGVRRSGVLRLYPLGRARTAWPVYAMSLADQMAVLDGLEVPEDMHLMQSWHPNDANCCYQNSAIDAHGNSIGCPYLREYVNYGNVREMSFMDTWDDPLYRELREGEVESHCSGCQSTQSSKGGCRSTAYAFHGRWDAPDPFCAETNEGVDLRELPSNLV